MVGAWKILDVEECQLPERVQVGFYEATEGLVGASYIPALYCAIQVVSGINHMIICKQTLTTNPPKEAIVKMILHEALPINGGNFTILSIDGIV